jgi:competence protein ComEA
MNTTPQERLALGVAVLLLAAGAAARGLTKEPEAAALTGPAGVDAGVRTLVAQVEDSVERSELRGRPLAPGERIDPNTASADELDRLDGVGPAMAARIVERRQARGPFRTLADLDSVSGIGPSTLVKIAPQVTLAAAPRTASSASPSFPAAASVADYSPSRKTAAAAPAAAPDAGGVVDVNEATAAQLVGLPGIGPALARRIVEWRTEHGPFRSVEGLAEVRGISPATVERLRPHVRASP